MKEIKSKKYQGGRGLSAQAHNEAAPLPAVWELMDKGRLVISIQAPLETTDHQLIEGLLDLASILCHDAGFTPDSIMERLEYGLLANWKRQDFSNDGGAC